MKTKLITLCLLTFLAVQFVMPDIVSAGLFDSAKGDACAGAQLKSAGNCGADTSGLNNTIENIIDIFSVIVGIIAVIMIIVNGLKFITSGGDANKVGSAKSGIIYAIVGIIIVALAQFIVKFVITNVG